PAPDTPSFSDRAGLGDRYSPKQQRLLDRAVEALGDRLAGDTGGALASRIAATIPDDPAVADLAERLNGQDPATARDGAARELAARVFERRLADTLDSTGDLAERMDLFRRESRADTGLTTAEATDLVVRRADSVVADAVRIATGLVGTPARPWAVVALGGYGRAEPAPASDLDFAVIGDVDRGSVDHHHLLLLQDLTTDLIEFARADLQHRLGDPAAKVLFEPDALWLRTDRTARPDELAANNLRTEPDPDDPHRDPPSDPSFPNYGVVYDSRLVPVDGLANADNSADSPVFDRFRETYAFQDRTAEARQAGSALLHTADPVVNPKGETNLKDAFLRPLTLGTRWLAVAELITNQNSTAGRIDVLEQKGTLSPGQAQDLRRTVEDLQGLRQKLHGHYGVEKDTFRLPTTMEKLTGYRAPGDKTYVLDKQEIAAVQQAQKVTRQYVDLLRAELRPDPATRPAPGTAEAQRPGPSRLAVADDPSWRHSTADTADWFAPQDPKPASQWESVRDKAPVRTVDTEVADVRRSSTPGRLDSVTGLIRHDVRRMEVEPGRWVKEYTLRVHLEQGAGASASDLADVRRKAVEGVDRLLNRGHRLPSGDQFHARVEFVDDPKDAHTTVEVTGSAIADQLHWGGRTSPNVLAHEVAHYFGLPDEYRDKAGPGARVFNSDGRRLPAGHAPANLVVPDNGLMGAGVHRDPELKPRHLWLIERTTDSQVMVPDGDHATLNDPN
ncbi:hypothetical protein J7S33_19180, partial [Saccharothrix algeriensis]